MLNFVKRIASIAKFRESIHHYFAFRLRNIAEKVFCANPTAEQEAEAGLILLRTLCIAFHQDDIEQGLSLSSLCTHQPYCRIPEYTEMAN